MIHASTHSTSLRRAYIDMLSSNRFPHALTLNTDRELSPNRLRSIFGNFCMNVDRVIHAKQHVSKLPSSDRFLAIAWPENLDTNAHLHVAADLRGFAARVGGIDPTALGKIWHRASRGAGSVHVQDMTSRGWASYITKKASGADPLYFISTDFHPN